MFLWKLGLSPILQCISPFLCAAAATTVSTIALMPGEVLKIKLQTGQHESTKAAMQSIYRSDGVYGFFIGYFATLSHDVPYTAIELGLYENIKSLFRKLRGRLDLSSYDELLSAAVTGAVTSFLTTPLDIAQTLFIAQSTSNVIYTSVINAITSLVISI
mmetsp:Transcript_21604/g.19669  ORF Transcript_21604/g.19669 Transcript_21604/m.19669 type:complete len:159 (+) Transcript_21604:42-518(+)